MHTAPVNYQPPSADPALVLLPEPCRLFAARADRFHALAPGHSLADWLEFLSALSRAQHDTLQSLPELPEPAAAVLATAREHGMAPLNAIYLPRPGIWIDVLRQLASALELATPVQARAALTALGTAPASWLEQRATALLAGEPEPEYVLELPLIAAALQVVWTAMASRLGDGIRPLADAPGICPCCGSLPVAGILRGSGAVSNLRYLHCSLCNTEWNLPRAVCTACGTDKGVAYHHIDGSNGAVRAETCDSCQSYLKLMVQDKDPGVDPVADDLASLALDLLVDEAGYQRSGPNLLLCGGAGE